MIPYWQAKDDYILILLSSPFKVSNPMYWNIFYVMYYTGIRVNEIDTLIVDSNMINWSITILASKDSWNRVFYKNDNPWMNSLNPTTLTNYLHINTKFKTSRAIYKYIPAATGVNEDYRITTHIFRYLYIYRLMEEGKTAAQISLLIGHKNIATTVGYINNINNMIG